MVKEITSLGEFEAETKYAGLVVVDFFTTWCGPCKQIAPFIDSLQSKYPDVKFIKVDIERNEDIAAPRRISSIPTFHFIVNGNVVDEMKGANPSSLEQKVVQHKVDVNPFGSGTGYKLSSATDSNLPPPGNAREARLRAFAQLETTKKPTDDNNEDDEAEALAKAMELSMAKDTSASSNNNDNNNDVHDAEYEAAAAEIDADNNRPPEHFQEAPGQEWEEEMVPVPVNEELLSQLVEMGFPDARARKGLVHGGSLDGAIAWIGEHQDDADIDQPYMVKKSDTIPKPPLTEEEKKQRQLAIQERIKQRRNERAKQEKADEIKREKERRERGQKMEETLEERQRLQRKRENERIKREKEEEKKERARLRAEIARDKEIRRQNKGVLPSVLGVDGYNPSIIQYDKPDNSTDTPADSNVSSASSTDKSNVVPAKRDTTTTQSIPKKKTTTTTTNTSTNNQTPLEKVDASIQTLLRYRTGGDGGNAIKLLLTFVKNIVEHPNEVKYQSINTESNAFRTKLTPLVGGVALLKAIGFVKDESDGKLKYQGEMPNAILTETLQKLIAAEALYRQQNN